jgi:tetratricopeptide (TPR) repeat protein
MLFNTLELNARHCARATMALMIPVLVTGLLLTPCKKYSAAPVVTIDEPAAESILLQAEQCKDAKDYPQALSLLDKYLALKPSSSRAYADQSYCLNGEHNYPKALVSAEFGLANDKSNVDALSNKAWALNHLERYGEALEASKTALNLDPTDAESWCEQGEALMGLGDYKSALVAFNKHCGLHSDEWYAYDRRAECYEKLGMKDAAEEDREQMKSL